VETEEKKVIVISGANLVTGGALTIIQECVRYLNRYLSDEYIIYCLVHNVDSFKEFKNIKFLEFKAVRNSYFNRIKFEYFFCRKLSLKLKPYLWFSLNDMSSSSISEKRAVYCHNAAPFRKIVYSDLFFEPSLFLFTVFYKSLYRINIYKNNYIIVQQEWLRSIFMKTYNLPHHKIIVSPPKNEYYTGANITPGNIESDTYTFFYPTFPRPFKNIEVIGKAIKILGQRKNLNFTVIITMDGTENRYSKYIVKRYGHLQGLRFIGLISKSEVYDLYNQTDCLLFPSKLESWGLPISEFKEYERPIILADLTYARETLGNYQKGVFFDADNPHQLADLMEQAILNKISFNQNFQVVSEKPNARSWKEVFDILLNS